MALTLFLRSSSKLAAPNAFLPNVARMSSSMSLVAANRRSSNIVQTSQIVPSSKLLGAQVPQVRVISTTAPLRSSATGNHVPLWSAERALSVALLGICPVAFIFPSQLADSLLALSMVVHSHWGLEAIVTDYIRPALFGEVIPKISHGILLLISAVTLGGLFYFIHHDIGIVNAIKQLWAVKGKQQ